MISGNSQLDCPERVPTEGVLLAQVAYQLNNNAQLQLTQGRCGDEGYELGRPKGS
jgi:hypothetical protein